MSEGFEKKDLPGIQKGQNHVGIQLNEFRGRTALDIREYYWDNDGDGLLHPSPRGLRVPLQAAREFAKCLTKIIEANSALIDAAEKDNAPSALAKKSAAGTKKGSK